MHIVLAAKPDADQPWITDAVARLAKQTAATVSVLAVDQVELERFSAAPRSLFLQGAREAVDAAVRRLAEAGVEAQGTVLSGRPLERIIEFAEQQQADVIMVGASTRPAMAERLLGSVPLQLIEKSSRPVLVVTHPS
ncbi:universal stress protein [Actinoplanes sp. ATCC 53533]|uniref:universal stress protein n=1 Tax=Actinoplanes sp. ATCC 53533 TaxID=1288362 RepID=UPI0013158A2F|nr:universal stress protein [Actinoplanes sp. ATCC 53533]